MEEKSNNVDEGKEDVDLDDNYDHLSQIRRSKKVDKVQAKQTL